VIAAGTRLGDYVVLDALGRGGMGVVYLARRASRLGVFGGGEPGDYVALKTVADGLALTDTALRRFAKEHEVLALLDHANVVRPFGPMQVERGVHFFAMEYVEGKSLGQLLAESGPLPPARAARVAVEVLRALAAAHERGIVHRDVKPTNVLLRRDGAVKVADFGLAHVVDWTRLTISSGALGTPSYMAPEQFESTAVDPRSDLYSVAAVLHEMLTGRPPFEAANAAALMLKHLEAEPPRPSRARGASPALAPFDDVVTRGLAKDPGGRYASAAEFAAALERACPDQGAIDLGASFRDADEPTARARGLDAERRLRRQRRRRRAAAAVAAIAALSLGAYGIVRLRGRGDAAPAAPAAGAPSAAPTVEPERIAVVTRHQGDPLRGRILRRDGERMVVETLDGRQVEVPLAEVKRVQFEPR